MKRLVLLALVCAACGGNVDRTPAAVDEAALGVADRRVLAEFPGAPGALVVRKEDVLWSTFQEGEVHPIGTLHRLVGEQVTDVPTASMDDFAVDGDDAVFVRRSMKETGDLIVTKPLAGGSERLVFERTEPVAGIAMHRGLVAWAEMSANDSVIYAAALAAERVPTRGVWTPPGAPLAIGRSAMHPRSLAIVDGVVLWLAPGELQRALPDAPAALVATASGYGEIAVHDRTVFFRRNSQTIGSVDAFGSTVVDIPLPARLGGEGFLAADDTYVYVQGDDESLNAVPRAGGNAIRIAESASKVGADDTNVYWLETDGEKTRLMATPRP